MFVFIVTRTQILAGGAVVSDIVGVFDHNVAALREKGNAQGSDVVVRVTKHEVQSLSRTGTVRIGAAEPAFPPVPLRETVGNAVMAPSRDHIHRDGELVCGLCSESDKQRILAQRQAERFEQMGLAHPEREPRL